MSQDDIRTVADVRREIWTQGFVGMGTGSVGAYVLHSIGRLGNNRNWWKLALTKNTAFASFMLGGALGSFLCASTAGKNEVHKMHPVFQVGAQVPGTTIEEASVKTTTSYQESLQRAKDREVELERRRSSHSSSSPEVEESRTQRARNRLFRRETLTKALEPGHGGLSDAHGGHWYHEKEGEPKK